MMPEAVQLRLQRIGHFRDRLLADVAPPRLRGGRRRGQVDPERLRRFVRQKHVDAPEPPCTPRPLRARSGGACRLSASPATPPPACRTTSAQTCRRARHGDRLRSCTRVPFGMKCRFGIGLGAASKRRQPIERLVVALDPIQRRRRLGIRAVALATSPTHSQNGMSGCLPRMRSSGAKLP